MMAWVWFYQRMFLVGLLIIGLMGCKSVRAKIHVPDHTQDYQMQDVSLPPLVSPPGTAPLTQDQRYQVSPPSMHLSGRSSAVSVIPPGSHLTD